ncbi:MAG: multicopper oxidase domain-containing protein [Nitrospira sp.]|nr:multicopper oxidase domain-containing protein [Nitrospira sp.]
MSTPTRHNSRGVGRYRMIMCLSAAIGMAGGAALPVHAKTHNIQMTAVESDIVIDGGGETYAAWTFNGQMPGPVVRVTEGDTINFTLTNPATNKNPHAMDFHAAEIDFLKNYRAVNAGETISYTFVAKKPGIFFYHCGAPPMIQHVARGMFGAIIVDPKQAKVWPKADREYVLVQSEYYKNPNDVQAMFDRKYDGMMFNGGIFKYHPFVTGGGKLDAKPGERVRIYFVNAGPNGVFLVPSDRRDLGQRVQAAILPITSRGADLCRGA